MLGVVLTLLGYITSQRNNNKKKKQKNRKSTPIGTPSYQIIRSQYSIKGHFKKTKKKQIENQTRADSSFVNQVNAVKLVKA